MKKKTPLSERNHRTKELKKFKAEMINTFLRESHRLQMAIVGLADKDLTVRVEILEGQVNGIIRTLSKKV